jgi:molybdopterin synthase sulfur carrier subunit
MSIRVKLHPYFQDVAHSGEIVEANGNTVAEIIDDLERQYPGMKEQLVDKNGRVQGFAELFVNAEIVHPLNTNMPVTAGDEIEILVIVSGG